MPKNPDDPSYKFLEILDMGSIPFTKIWIGNLWFSNLLNLNNWKLFICNWSKPSHPCISPPLRGHELTGLGWSHTLPELFPIDFSRIDDLWTCINTENMKTWIFGNIIHHYDRLKLPEIPERPLWACRGCLTRAFSPKKHPTPPEIIIEDNNNSEPKDPRKACKWERRVPEK